jgi:two-component system, cell cycle sensor histidine kinase and response regulator CckA
MSADARKLTGEGSITSAAQVRALGDRVRSLEAELERLHHLESEVARVNLVASERQFRRIVETAAEGVWTVDAANVTTFVNEAMARMLGYVPAQMLGRHLFEFLPEEVRDGARESTERRIQGIREVHEVPLLHRDGHEVWSIMSTSPILGDDGSYQGALAMVTDTTEKRRAERERAELTEHMLESQKTESLGVLAGGIAHDFNNLLAAVMGHVEIASQDKGLSARSRTALSNALAASQRAAGLTRQLLDYSGRGELALRPLRLTTHSTELVELLRASIPKRVSIELSTPDHSLTVMADPDRLQQATMNLVINAAESYGTSAGVVRVEVGLEEVGPGGLPWLRSGEPIKPGEYVYLEVRDQGGGMDEATLKRVFEPFFTTKTSGRGLGLAATLGIVRTHGGHLLVRSRLGAGTTFRAYFPRCREAEEQAVTELVKSPAVGTPRTRTLLVVDDEPMVREFAHRLLEAEGYHVIEAGSGREALSELRERSADIDGVLLDLSMPGMDGDALLSELRSFAPALPVIVHSGHSLESTSERLSQWNIAGVLQKPYRAARLSEMVRSLFGDPSTS